MKFEELKQRMLTDVSFKEKYLQKDLKFQVSQMVFDARVLKGFTQTELAKKIGTKQPSIARIENGSELPSLTFLEKIAKALDTYLKPPVFGFMNNYHDEIYDTNVSCKSPQIEDGIATLYSTYSLPQHTTINTYSMSGIQNTPSINKELVISNA